MVDIVPELYQKIVAEYDLRVKGDSRIQTFRKRLQNGDAASGDVSLYAGWLGDHAADALEKYLAPQHLPGGVLYWNILEGTVKPLLRSVYDSVMEAAETVTAREDKEIGIGIKPVRPSFPEERVNALMGSMLERENTNAGKPS